MIDKLIDRIHHIGAPPPPRPVFELTTSRTHSTSSERTALIIRPSKHTHTHINVNKSKSLQLTFDQNITTLLCTVFLETVTTEYVWIEPPHWCSLL